MLYDYYGQKKLHTTDLKTFPVSKSNVMTHPFTQIFSLHGLFLSMITSSDFLFWGPMSLEHVFLGHKLRPMLSDITARCCLKQRVVLEQTTPGVNFLKWEGGISFKSQGVSTYHGHWTLNKKLNRHWTKKHLLSTCNQETKTWSVDGLGKGPKWT